MVVPVVRSIDRKIQILNRWSRSRAAIRDFGVDGDMIVYTVSVFLLQVLWRYYTPVRPI